MTTNNNTATVTFPPYYYNSLEKAWMSIGIEYEGLESEVTIETPIENIPHYHFTGPSTINKNEIAEYTLSWNPEPHNITNTWMLIKKDDALKNFFLGKGRNVTIDANLHEPGEYLLITNFIVNGKPSLPFKGMNITINE